MAYLYAFANQKGGVGKTTTVVNIAAYIAEAGMKVLVLDMDPQANATASLGFSKSTITKSMYDLLLENASPSEIVITNKETNVSLIPASSALAGAEVELVGAMAREYRLQRILDNYQHDYDYILIDCPPSLGMLTINAFVAAKDGVIIPVQCEYLALEGLSQLVQTIELVKQHLNRKLKIRGLILTMYDGRTKLSREVVEEVRKHFPDLLFRAMIPRNIRLSEAPSFGQPISLYAPDSTGGLAYKVLTAELLQTDSLKKSKHERDKQ